MSGLASRLRGRFVDSPESFGARRRAARWDLAREMFPDIERQHVVDLGGTVEWWRRAPLQPASVTVINLFEPGESDSERWVPVQGDACDARRTLEAAGRTTSYDLVFSNSLIEHVGGHAQRAKLAEEVRSLAPRYWVQTPYRYFPVEPHWLFPMLQFLPMALRAPAARVWPLAHSRPADRASAMAEVQWTELIGIAELRAYFPDAHIEHERVAGLTKSIIAVAGATGR